MERKENLDGGGGGGGGRGGEMFLPRLIRGPGAESEFFSVDANFLSLWHQPHSLPMIKGPTRGEGTF